MRDGLARCHLIENFFGKLKEFNFTAIIYLATGVINSR